MVRENTRRRIPNPNQRRRNSQTAHHDQRHRCSKEPNPKNENEKCYNCKLYTPQQGRRNSECLPSPTTRPTSPEIQRTKPKMEIQRTVGMWRSEGEEKANETRERKVNVKTRNLKF